MRELPDLIGDFFDLTKRYFREQLVDPAKRLGRLAGLSFAGAMLFIIASGFFAVSGMRWIQRAMPDGMIWSGVGYLAASVGLFAVTGLVMWRASR